MVGLWVLTRFIEHVQTELPGGGIKEQLEVLCHTYALFQIIEHAGDFLATGYMTGKQIALAKEQLKHQFDKVRYRELLVMVFRAWAFLAPSI